MTACDDSTKRGHDAPHDSVEQIDPASATFRRLECEDIQAVLSLEKECFAQPWTESQFNLAFQQRIFHVFGFMDNDGRLLAYLAFYHTAGEMEILNLAVRPRLRRQGLGKRLLGIVLQIGVRLGAEEAFLEVRVSNTAARRLYASFDFEQVGRRKKYYPDTGEDALVLRREMRHILNKALPHTTTTSNSSMQSIAREEEP